MVADGLQFPLSGLPFQVLRCLCRPRLDGKGDGSVSPEEVCNTFYELYREPMDPRLVPQSIHKIRGVFHEAFKQAGRFLTPFHVVETIITGLKYGHDEVARYRLGARTVSLDDAQSPTPADAGLRILVVEDSQTWQRDSEETLRALGFQVWSVGGGHEVAAALEQHEPDLLCLDLGLPLLENGPALEDGGLKVLEEVRASRPGMRALVLSQMADRDRLRRKGLAQGIWVDDWISKDNPEWRSLLARSCTRLETEKAWGGILTGFGPIYRLELFESAPRKVILEGVELRLSENRAKLLRLLAKKPLLPVDTETLMEELYQGGGSNAERENEALIQLVKALRDQIAKQVPTVGRRQLIKDVKGGWLLAASPLWHT